MAGTESTFSSDVEPPLVLDDPTHLRWDCEADVVVVGFGGAGATAAIEALERGASVIALDRFSGGGATAFSGGVTYAGGTRHQKAAGYDDDAANMYAYLSQEDCAVGAETLKRYCEGSNADLEWLEKNGVPFSGDAFLDKATYPPEGKFLYFSGNEKVPSYKKKANPAPRGHRAVGAGFTGLVHFEALKKSALTKGLALQPHAPAKRLIIDRSGAVLGVETVDIPDDQKERHEEFYRAIVPMKPFANGKYEKAIASCRRFERGISGRRNIRARKGVILSAGGYVYNVDMMRRTRPTIAQVFRSFVRLGSMGCDGSGIELGCSVGGATDLMDSYFIGRSISPPAAFLRGILVDQKGSRFINEDAYTSFIGNAISDLPGEGRAWLILDKAGYRSALHQCLFPGKGMYIYTLPSLLNIFLGGTRKSATLAGLAKKCGFALGTLEASVRSNNTAADGNRVDDMGKGQENLAPIARPPFYAINMDLGNPYTATLLFTLGGLKVNETTGAVLRADGTSIPGLYAAGRTAVGLCSKSYLSGLSLSDTVFSGRRAARAILGANELAGVEG